MVEPEMRARVEVERSGGMMVRAVVDLDPSEIVAIVGPNGAGKTTTLLAIAGLINGGSFDGGAEPKVGMVFQDGLLFPHLTVRENVAFGATADVEETLSRFGLTALADSKPDVLSGGEAQRAAIARTMATEPDVLLLDEPMASLDATAKLEMRRFLSDRLTDIEQSVVLVAHDPLDVLGIADRVLVLERGSVVQEGSASDLRSRPANRFVADLVGVNLLEGVVAIDGVLVGDVMVQVVTSLEAGTEVLLQIQPAAIAFHSSPPDGSARNVWRATVRGIETLGQIARVTFDEPIPLTAEVTEESVERLSLRSGADVYVAIKATEVVVRPR